jgi:hypothetical protein
MVHMTEPGIHATTSSVAPGQRPDELANVMTLRICGVALAIEGLLGELHERFSALMRPFEADFAPADAAHLLQVRQHGSDMAIVRDGKVVAAYGDPHLLLTQLEWHTVTMALEATEVYLPVHGAALSNGSATVLMLAESGAGKTTLTLGLMRRGWQPLADDIVLVDSHTLAIQPFPRCFHVDESTRALAMEEALVEWPGSVRDYARPLQWAEGQSAPHTILLVERCPTCPSRLRGLTLAEAAAAVGNNAIRGRIARSRVAQIAVGMATGAAGGGRLSNGHLDDALDLIESVCRG